MKKLDYDQHIINALKQLPVPLKTFDGHDVLFDEDKRKETIFEHIANKTHHLHLKDIEDIKRILSTKESLKPDKSGKKFRTYIGKHSKQKERLKYLKITTRLKKDNKESVVTIHNVKNNS